MDRNFERVYQLMVKSVQGELRLTKDFMNYYGYHEAKTDLLPEQRKQVYFCSIWHRFKMDLFRSSHQEVSLYLFAAKAIFNINLIPYLNEALNALLPETHSDLPIQGWVSSETVEHLEAYLLWKVEDGALERLLVILEAGLIREMVLRSINKPDGEDFLFDWLVCRQGDKYAIKPQFQIKGIHEIIDSRPTRESEHA